MVIVVAVGCVFSSPWSCGVTLYGEYMHTHSWHTDVYERIKEVTFTLIETLFRFCLLPRH